MFKILSEKMGKDKGSILKAKYVDVKKISAQIEEDLRHKSEKLKEKKKPHHRRFESCEKIEVDMKKKASMYMPNYIDDTKMQQYPKIDLKKLHSKVFFYKLG